MQRPPPEKSFAAGFAAGTVLTACVTPLVTRRLAPRAVSPAPAEAGVAATRQSAHLSTASTRVGALTRDELGRSTWTLLHALAAQFPEQPTRQQSQDACELVRILSRIFPCRECATHFAELVRADPPQAGSRHELSQWLCRSHNAVNARLGKPAFNCARADARWAMNTEECGDACGPPEDARGGR